MTVQTDTGRPPPAPAARRRRGQRAWHAGAAAERTVARYFERRGAVERERRWRGQGGEIDLILSEGGEIVFCEVKAARSFDAAVMRLSEAQMLRIHAAAAEYLGGMPDGQLSQVRFDLALVDGQGNVRVMENAFGHF